MKREKTTQQRQNTDSSQRVLDRDPIAIIGIGCRYPGASNPDELWRNLLAGRESVGPYPGGRFAELDRLYEQTRAKPGRLRTDRGGFLADIAGFDSQFFEISPRESIYIDPQHRLLLEVAWEALEDAGQTREAYENSATGVYLGLWTNEYESRLYESGSEGDFYSVTGCGRFSASGRLSFMFGFQGPSLTIDTACSSSLVAAHMACQSLWAGEIEMALAGGANLILGTEISELFTKANMLSSHGSCRFGDESADGFVRSEGAGIVVLKRLSRALADNDPIYAVIRGSAVNNDGRSSGFLVTPSRAGQQEMLRTAWKSAGVQPKDICYIEMHGTGTSVGDPVEISAVGAALAEAGVSEPCALGSIKTNIGHSESAAGVAGLIKAALTLKHRTIPPSLHFRTPSPKVAWDAFPVRVVTEPVRLPEQAALALVGVSSFGLSGTNAHMVLEEAGPLRNVPPQLDPYLLTISARNSEALDELLQAHLSELRAAGPEYPIGDVCYTASVRRNHHEYRVAIIAEDLAELETKLAAAIAKEDSDGVVFGRESSTQPPTRNDIVFVAPGQGSQWLGMAGELFDRNPVFRQAFEQCDAAIHAETGWSLIDRVIGPDAATYLTQIDVIQPALFAMSVALAAVWRSWGILPSAVVGHSMGEVAAAHIAGILDLKDAVAVICRRSRLMKTLSSAGSMATVELPLAEVEQLLESVADVSVAASNGPHTTVISGDTNAIEALLRDLTAKDIYCRQIKVDVASHSAQVDPILPDLLAALSDICPRPAEVPLLSTVTGKYAQAANDSSLEETTWMDAPYWVENLRRSVLFAPAIKRLCGDGKAVFIELSPHPILLPSIEASARAVQPRAVAVASLRREKPACATLLAGLAALYAAGWPIDWRRLYPNGARSVRLPQYPFQRECCWPEPGDLNRTQHALRTGQASPLLGHKFESSLDPKAMLWETDLRISTLRYLNDHRVLRSAVFPASGHIDMALSAAREMFPDQVFEVRNAVFASAAYIPEQGARTFQLALTPDGNGAYSFAIRSRGDEGESAWPLRSHGILQPLQAEALPAETISLDALQAQCAMHRDAQDHYARTTRCGLQYGPAFQLVQEAWVGDFGSLCRLQIEVQDGEQDVIHPAILDACFQAVIHLRPEHKAFAGDDTYLPVAIETIRIYGSVPDHGELYAQARLVSADPLNGTFRTDIRLFDPAGHLLMDVTGMEVRRVAHQSLPGAPDPLYSLEWVLQDADPQAGDHARGKAEARVALLSQASSENWIVFGDDSGIAKAMRESLEFIGGNCTLVRPGSEFKKVAKAEFEINPSSQRDLEQLFDEVAMDKGVPTAVVHLWTLDSDASGEYDAEMLIAAQAEGSQHVPAVVRAIAAANWQNPPRLWLVTAGAMPAGEPTDLLRIANAPMWGIGLTIAREHPEVHATLVDLSVRPDENEARELAFLICSRGKEDRIALRGNATYVARLASFSPQLPEVQPKPLASGEQYRIEIPSPGILDHLELRRYKPSMPSAGEVRIDVQAAGLNFIDVTKVMGIYPGLDANAPIRLGIECAGTVAAVGEGVQGFEIGEQVIAVTPAMQATSMLASAVTVPAQMVLRKPAKLSVDEAATTPIAFLTAYYSLVELARVRKGDWVLIHAAAGGVGLAAIEIARWVGAKVIATVGSKEKEDYVRSLGIEHVFNSRSLTFAAGVMEATGGRGVDIVLNSLTGEFQSKGLEVLAPYGRFIELGKRDIYDDRQVGLKVFRKNLSFHAVDLAAAIEERPSYVVGLLRAVVGHIESGDWRPLPVHAFSAADPSVPVHFMAQARHIGKIAVHMDRNVNVLPATDRLLFSRDSTYLIAGGLGGVALTVAEWMAENGAGHLVLLSRRSPSGEASEAIRGIEQRGARVVALQGDITREADLVKVLETIHAEMPPLKGVLQAAAVVDDALVADLSAARFLPVMAPKITGTWNLHQSTLHEDLDFFVMFSSIAAVHPQPGMGSYAAANAFLDGFAHYRRALGLPATSVNWGGWDQTGLAQATGTEKSLAGYGEQGIRNFSRPEALAAFGRVLETNPVQVVAAPFDWEKFAAFHGPNGASPAFSSLSRSSAATEASSNRSEILDRLTQADSIPQRQEMLELYLQEVLGRVLKLATRKIDRERPLGSMGLDSLMGLEFVRRLSNTLEIPVPATVVFNYPTIQQMATHFLRRLQLTAADELNASAEKPNGAPGLKDGRVDGLSDGLTEEDALHALMSSGPRSS
ncbi:MAG: type I polyketide synthase [Acidobacteriaceae bacterium]